MDLLCWIEVLLQIETNSMLNKWSTMGANPQHKIQKKKVKLHKNTFDAYRKFTNRPYHWYCKNATWLASKENEWGTNRGNSINISRYVGIVHRTSFFAQVSNIFFRKMGGVFPNNFLIT